MGKCVIHDPVRHVPQDIPIRGIKSLFGLFEMLVAHVSPKDEKVLDKKSRRNRPQYITDSPIAGSRGRAARDSDHGALASTCIRRMASSNMRFPAAPSSPSRTEG
ncbi:hypothetical protein KU6B_02640 [Mameliella alba]|nr:hypothetical protein KU6B_02640 [Mameliella alba]